MIKRFGSTGLATILGIGGLVAVGVGSFAAYKSYTGECGLCCSDKAAVATPVALTEEASSCALGCSGEKKAACDASTECCEGKDAAECCKGDKGATVDAANVIPAVLAEGATAECAEKAAKCSGEAKASCADKAAECTGEKKAGCSEKATECTGEKGDSTAAADGASNG